MSEIDFELKWIYKIKHRAGKDLRGISVWEEVAPEALRNP